MAIRRIGNTTPRIVHESWTRRPSGEVDKVVIWEGFEPDLQSISLQYQNQGYETDIDRQSGSWKQMRVNIPNAEAGDTWVDIWEIQTEWAQVDIRGNPNVLAQVQAYLTRTGSTATPREQLREWVKLIKEIINDGTAEPAITAAAEFMALYNFYAAGGEAFEQERIVLRHRRVMHNIFIAPMALEAVPKFYSKAALVSAFGVPNDIAAELPSAGDTLPDGFTWGWRRREATSILNRGEGRREQVRDWVFAGWSTLAYAYVS